VSAQLTWRPSMRRGRQGRQRIARLVRRKCWHFRRNCSVGLAIYRRSGTIAAIPDPKRRFQLTPAPASRGAAHSSNSEATVASLTIHREKIHGTD
jgi:hypothetical protein